MEIKMLNIQGISSEQPIDVTPQATPASTSAKRVADVVKNTQTELHSFAPTVQGISLQTIDLTDDSMTPQDVQPAVKSAHAKRVADFVKNAEAELQSLLSTIQEVAAKTIKRAETPVTEQEMMALSKPYDLPLKSSKGVGNYMAATRAFLKQSRSTQRPLKLVVKGQSPHSHCPEVSQMDTPQGESWSILSLFQSQKPSMSTAIYAGNAHLSRLMVRATGLDW